MANVFDYLSWRGDLSFSAAPFCEADNLILCLLSYLDFSHMVLEGDTVGLPLEQAAPLYFRLHPPKKGSLGLLLSDEIPELLTRAAATPRFARVRLWGHRSRLDETRGLQFSATAFSLGCGTDFVAFRGTDDTLVGWKEDFQMAVRCPVPAQEEARDYLNFVGSHTSGPLLLGGHSKGGNLAVYAAACCREDVQSRIELVWSNDGPGFLPDVLKQSGFRSVRDRVRSFIPRSGMVGLILSSDWPIEAVESSALGALQHNALTWQILGRNFVRAQGLSRSSMQADKTFHALLQELTPAQRQQVIDDVFSVGDELGAKTLTDLFTDTRKRDTLRSLAARLTGFDKDTRDSLFRALRVALRMDDEDLRGE